MKTRFTLILFFAVFSRFVYSQTTLNLATGSEGGIYFSIGQGLKAAIEKACPDITIALNPTAGSVDNARLLSYNEVQLALIQSDIARNFRKGERMFKFPSESMMGIASLFPEVIHLVARKGSGLQSVSDLRGKTVALGELNSGARYNAEDILAHAGLKDSDLIKKYLSPLEIKDGLSNNTIDAAFFTSGIPSQLIVSMSDKVDVIGLDESFISGLINEFPYFDKCSINEGNYPDQKEKINSVCVSVYIVARKDLDLRMVKKITEAIYTNTDDLIESHVVAKNINLDSGHKVKTLELHPGAKEYYADSERIERAFSDYLLDWTSYFILILLIGYSIYKHKKFRYNFSRNQYFQIGVILLAFFTIGTLGTYWFEKSVNKNFDNIIDTFWTTLIYLLSGFEGNNPITVGGKISSIFILLGSVALLGSVIGHFTTLFIKESNKKMPVDLKKHIAICYWSSRGDTIVKELRNSEKAANKEIIILHDNDLNEKELRSKNNHYKNVFFIEGDPTDSKALSDARVPYAESVIILASKNDSSADPMTILTCLSIEKLCKKLEIDKPHIIAELMNRDNREIALEAGADEIVSAGYYRTGIMLQTALYPNLSDIFHELLTYGEDKTSVFIVEADHYSKDLFGKNFPELISIINKNRDEVNPVILFGIRRGKTMMVNPQKIDGKESNQYFDTLEEGDALVVLAEKFPDLTKINV